MESNSGKPNALVVSVNCDRPSKFIHQSAATVQEELDRRGFNTLTLEDEKATAENLYELLYNLAGAEERLSFAFIIAHGRSDSLIGFDGMQLIDAQCGPLLAGCVVVMNACLKTGELPSAITSGRTVASGVLGYDPKLLVPSAPNDQVAQVINSLFRGDMRKRFMECVAGPAKDLINSHSLSESLSRGRLRWEEYVTDFDDDFLATSLKKNVDAIKIWTRSSNEVVLSQLHK